MAKILGLSCFYHDSAAAYIENGEIIAAAQEERFTRKKHDPGFPEHAIACVLNEGAVNPADLDYVSFYDKPFLKFERLLESILDGVPRSFRVWMQAIPTWLDHKLLIDRTVRKYIPDLNPDVVFHFPEHHESHAAAAFFPSPFESAAFLTTDGVGEWATTSWGLGNNNTVQIMQEIHFPHSLGLLYSAFTAYTGFKVNSGEYKVMGLAPYGEPEFVQKILDNVIDIKEDGSYRLNMEYFNYAYGLSMTTTKFHNLFGAPPRKPETKLTQREMNLAKSIQVVIEQAVMKLGKYIHKETGEKNLVMAGGVALNCVANGKLLREGPFENIWVQPAAGDAGSAIGAPLLTHYQLLDNPRKVVNGRDFQKGSYLGPSFSSEYIKAFLTESAYPFEEYANSIDAARATAKLIASENVVGWFSGRMEFGPRALGGRSIIGDPRSKNMQSVMNLKIKFRESFRPFAPSCLREDVGEFFEHDSDSDYMLIVAPVKEKSRLSVSKEQENLFGIDKLNVVRSLLPAITHVDYSARIQTVKEENHPAYYALIKEFKNLTGYGIIINTSFNVRGEPIVCTPEEAYTCFMRTNMDYLVLNNFILSKTEQPEWTEKLDWKDEFELD